MLSTGPAPRAWVMGRGDWVEANMRSIERAIEPMLVRTVEAHAGRGSVDPKRLRTKALGAQVGALFGYVSRKVMGQFDPFLPPDDDGLIYFVGPNLLDAEGRFGLDAEDFRKWIALHEVAHKVQFSHANWLRGHVLTSLDTYIQMTQLDAKRIAENLGRLVGEIRGGAQLKTLGIMYALMTPEQRAVFLRMQATMALVEGHASYVMNETAERAGIATLPHMKRMLASRRSVGGLEKTFQQAIGFDQKIRQYGTGEAFVSHVVERAGMGVFNRVWSSPATLPHTEEIAEPERWLARVG
jgi:coenzyme F420 biosynthesis associated uncharacterized protein